MIPLARRKFEYAIGHINFIQTEYISFITEMILGPSNKEITRIMHYWIR